MDTLIGITEDRLSEIIRQAYRQGREDAHAEEEQGQWLTSRSAICRFLSPDKPISEATFNRNRARGMYGEAVIGVGARCKARKNDLLQAIQQYQLSTL